MKSNIALIAAILMVSLLACWKTFSHAYDDTNRIDGKGLDIHALEQIVSSADNGGKPGAAGVKAPGFTLKTTNGTYYTVGGKRDKPMVLHFWASWCDACSVAESTLTKLYEQYNKQIDFVGVNVTTEEKPGNMESFVMQNHIQYPILLDEHKHAADLYELHALPTFFLIDRGGDIIDTFHMEDPMELMQKVEKLAEQAL
ncbi:TlpA family protein disulfide reductase [Paenibacillus hexagrammi]|uniref:TlpA family protein disulfide reductase n=1 Tax=Paenibacillus hexagrammi TaxID=2908839 RepID=A0ABY3SRL8_9BACL|nr:TlpA disulfide reductase family protein [Paenibacillus sp. YPD9-1]UJF35811.1 TlpA family protein disulfide reductase [Paenibacillus sp. YPD9-1]